MTAPTRSGGAVPALRCLAALLAGAGGLAAELALLRRHGLLLGNTSDAATAVLATFLVGLGIGSLLAARFGGARRSPLLGAAAYALVAVLVFGGGELLGAVLARHGPVGPLVGFALAVLVPGLPAAAMGLAFPLLFHGLHGRLAPALLVATNTAGSVVAAWAAGNFAIPLWGIGATLDAAAVAYLGAAVLAFVAGVRGAPQAVRVGATTPAPRTWPTPAPGALRTAGASGLLLLGHELLLLRRMPFFLEGFQPTLSGVVAGCLFAVTLGAAAAPWLARVARPGVVLVFGALAAALAIPEWVGPWLGRWPVDGDTGLHLRILGTAFAAAFLPCFAAGAVPAMLLVEAAEDDRDRLAGLLFLAQGIGALAASLGVGWLAPALFPERFFVATPLAVVLAVLLAAARPGASRPLRLGVAALAVLLALVGAGGPGSLLDPRPPIVGSRNDRPGALRPLAHRVDRITTASVAHDRRNHGMVLFTDEFRAAETGPGTAYMRVLGHLPFLLRADLAEVAVIALGTGTTAAAVVEWPDPTRIHVVEISSAVLSLADRFAGDGPVPTGDAAPFLADPRTVVHLEDGRRWLADVPERSLDLVTMEPLLPYAPGTAPLYSAEFYALARTRLAADGLLVQWIPTHSMPTGMFETLVATFCDAFPHTSAWLVDQSTLLVGSATPHLADAAPLAARLAAAPAAARATLHEAGIAGLDDLRAAFVGRLDAASWIDVPRLVDDRPFLESIGYWSGERRLGFLGGNLAVLAEQVGPAPFDAGDLRNLRVDRLLGLRARSLALPVLDPTGVEARAAVKGAALARSVLPRSVLLHHEETLALRRLIERETDPTRSESRVAVRLAEEHLRRDPTSALLRYRALAAEPRLDPEEVARIAALDPTLIGRLAAQDPRLADVAPGVDGELPPSPLDDLAQLPGDPELARIAARDDPRGAVYRAAYPYRCAVALIAQAAERPLDDAETRALAPLLDPATFETLAAVVLDARGPAGLVLEVLPMWRRDLPPPPSLVGTLATDPLPERRERLGEALVGRRDAASLDLLADLLVDESLIVRRTAAAALLRSPAGDRIRYDPAWGPEQRQAAAEALRNLHRRDP